MNDLPSPDPCPWCDREFVWDAATDSYLGTVSKSVHMLSDRIEVTLECCPSCGGTVAVSVCDEHGEEVYLPTSNEWNQKHGY